MEQNVAVDLELYVISMNKVHEDFCWLPGVKFPHKAVNFERHIFYFIE